MTSLTQLGLAKSRLTVFVMIGLIMMGSILYLDFAKREQPEITIRTAVVTATYPGMPPLRLEKLIAEPIERKIREIAEVEDIDTLLVSGRVTIHVTLFDRYTELDEIWQELRDKMEEVALTLPSESNGPYVNTDYGDVTIASIAMTAEGFTHAEMTETAKTLQRELYTLDGVAKVDFYGKQEERIWLEFDAKRLAAVGIQLPVLIDDLRQQNVILPAGELNAAGTSFLLEASGDFATVEQIANLLSRIPDSDNFVRLGDIVNIRKSYVDPPRDRVFVNGRAALVIGVQMQSGYDILAVGDRISAHVADFESRLPIGYVLDLITFQAMEVDRAVKSAINNVAQTFIVVLLVVMGFLGIRTGIVIASIVPFAVLFALIGMRVLGISLEQVSIAAVIISLGLLVDNGVVIVEDVLRRIQNGDVGSAAALAAGKQFAVPLGVSSATTIFAFLPFFMLEGGEGEYAYSLGAVVTLTLVGSWLSSMYLLPLIASRFVRTKTQAVGDSAWTAKYKSLLEKVLGHSMWIIAAGLLLVVGGVFLFKYVPAQMFPASDRGEVLIYMDMPKNTHISETERVAQAVGRWLVDKTQNPEAINHVAYVGDGGPRFYLALNPAEVSPSSAFLLVNTTDADAAETLLSRARTYLYTHFPEARFRVKRLVMGASESGTVEIKLKGDDPNALLTLAREVEDVFHGTRQLVENQHDWGEKVLKIVIDVDQNKARRLGITSESLSRILGAYFDGYNVSSFRGGDETVPIVLRASADGRDAVEDLASITVMNEQGDVIPLDQVAMPQPQLAFSQIRRTNQRLVVTVTAKSDAMAAAELLASVQGKLDALALPQGVTLEVGGELADSGEIYSKLAAGLPAAFTLMLLVIIFQFDSFRKTFIVFLTVPLVLVGTPVGLLLTGQPLSFMSILGLISLAGIVINNGIVLIDQIDIERREANLDAAIATAGQKRIRPILLTSVTTVLGLVPLYLFGGPLWQPLAAVIIGGLSIASVLTVFFVPAAYRVAHK